MTDAVTTTSARPPRNQWWDVWDQFKTHKGAMFGTVVFFAVIALIVLGPYIWAVDAKYINIRARDQGMSLTYPLGTDQLGRDMLARVIAGGKTTLAVGLAAMALSMLLGTLVGVLSGFFKRADGALMRLTDLFLALPLLPLLLLMVMLFREPLVMNFGPEMGIFILIVVAIAVTSWMNTARIVRGEVLTIKEREFVLAARSIGTPSRRIITRHILPSVMSPIMVSATLGIANAVITESALSFLGLGFPPDFPTWGRLLQDGMPYINLHPERVLWPALVLSALVLSVNYIGDGLRDALDPRIRGR
ncbi:peptide/nickel transport system permease protein [Gemmobacter megaterium]|uniref:Peptide/nickel transport system permease protein n=1 Tax=Gemmobacter megaterium TaxID=1086013 RepID=A0A1N7P6P4_9RHOB|nr:ABC transporter permease [Gemmobacter megaterium]GGE20201.1 peptide ABC transporter permease [Gemmobacter megaterium]SIT06197.1 peptide/nickel transport system permease protein [Gemmobacter megaterium]